MKKSFLRRGPATAFASGLVLTGAVLAQGCLQREVNPQKPNTSNVFVEQIANTAISEIDLLFVIDNSVSMADKQEILKKAVPQMVKRLINPLCLDANDNPTVPSVGGECAEGTTPEFTPVEDIHIGVISSSLGGHGSTSCARGIANPDSPSGFWDNDDQGHLMPTVRSNIVDKGVEGLGFLAWTGGDEDASDALIASFEEHVVGTGEYGCGFEAPLEAWYRFLVDPSPPQEMVIGEGNRAVSTGIDPIVLTQREAFLRPEGLVAVVLLTDENDCSAMDGGSYYNNAGFGYLVANLKDNFRMPVATPMCEENPNDKCCFSCLQASDPPAGCDGQANVCGGDPLIPELDRANARCFENKRRFGVDLLYPTERYVDALTKPEIIDARTSETVDNPLLRGAGETNKGKPRDPGLVFFAGIVGVPWQDIATPESLANPSVMQYLTAQELSAANVTVGERDVDRWEIILGQPGLSATSKRCEKGEPECGAVPIPPLDPFMIEQFAPRTVGATNPISGDAIVGADSTNPLANNINGHEANHTVVDPALMGPANDDLQYACIFPLEDPKLACTTADGSCDCGDEPLRNRPLCQPPTGGAAGNDQYFGKAYPGTRILQVLKDFGANSIVGSICPKITTGDASNPAFGYNPAVQAIVDRLAEKLTGKCLPRELSIDENGSVPCSVVEARPEDQGALDCSSNGRKAVGEKTRPAVISQLQATGRCGGDSGIDCNTYQMCEIVELLDEGRSDCLYDEADAASFPVAGFCYIDPAKQDEDGNYIAGGDAENTGLDGFNPIVANCPATERRLLRFAGALTPAPDSITFVACTGDAASSDAPLPPAAIPSEPEAGTGGTGMGGAGGG